MRYLLTVVLLFSIFASFAQAPDSVKVDTVVIYKEPVKIKKTIFVEDSSKERHAAIWISGFGSMFTNFDYYSTCSCYQSYYNDFKKATTIKTGNMEGLSFNYLYKRFYAEASIFLTNYREGFSYDSAGTYNTTNSYHYSSISISPGYLLVRGKVSIIASAGYVLNKLDSYNGLTLSLANKTAVNITSERKLMKYYSGAIVSFKFLYAISNHIDAIVDLFYMADLHSVTPSGQPFILQRNTTGIKAGLGFRF